MRRRNTLELLFGLACFGIIITGLSVLVFDAIETHQYSLQTNGKVYRIYDRYRREPALIYSLDQKADAMAALPAWNGHIAPFKRQRAPSPWTSGEWKNVRRTEP